MLLNGTKVINKKVLCAILCVVLCVVLVLLLGKMFIDYYCKHYFPSSDVYYQKMLSSLKTSDEVVIKDVFDFEFDKAYVASEIYGDQEYFIKVLNLDKKVYIPTLDSGGYNRIFFVKDNELVYDFIYDRGLINIIETGAWISPDTILEMDLDENLNFLYINIK